MNLEDKRKKIFSAKLDSPSRAIVIGGISEDDIKDLPTKEQILKERIELAELKAKKYLQEAISKAEEEAAEIINNAKLEEQSIRDNAYNEGYTQGEQDALKAVSEEFNTLLENCSNILSSLEQEKKEALAEEESAILDFIFSIAAKIIGKELSLDKESMLSMIKTAIAELNYKQEVNLFLPMDTAKHLEKMKQKILDEFPDLKYLTIIPDPDLKDGDLIIESKKERLDFRLSAQMETLLQNLKQRRVFKAEELDLKAELSDED